MTDKCLLKSKKNVLLRIVFYINILMNSWNFLMWEKNEKIPNQSFMTKKNFPTSCRKSWILGSGLYFHSSEFLHQGKISYMHRASDWFKKCIWRIPGLYSHCRSLHKLEWSFMMLSKGDRTTVEKNVDRKKFILW